VCQHPGTLVCQHRFIRLVRVQTNLFVQWIHIREYTRGCNNQDSADICRTPIHNSSVGTVHFTTFSLLSHAIVTNHIDSSYIVCVTLKRRLFLISPPPSGLFLSVEIKFLERGQKLIFDSIEAKNRLFDVLSGDTTTTSLGVVMSKIPFSRN